MNPTDSQIVNLYMPFKDSLSIEMDRVISVSETEMLKDRPESILTNFLADLLLEEGKKLTIHENLNFQPAISYINYGGIRAFLPKGEIKLQNIFELMPFENEMVFLKLNGTQVKKFFDNVAAKGGDGLGGVRFIISNGKATSILVLGKELNPGEDYWIVTNDYVAEGGDGWDLFTRRSSIVKTGRKIRDVIIAHMEGKHVNNKTLFSEVDGRIKYE